MLVVKHEDIDKFEGLVRSCRVLMNIMRRARSLGLENYYIGAGCVMQVIWNKISGNDDLYGIKDIDIVYYDDVYVSKDSEKLLEEKVMNLYNDIDPYKSVDDAIRTWPTTASAIGIRLDDEDNLVLCAPYGVSDLMNMIIRPNKVQITKDIYMSKVKRWKEKWPALTVVAW